MVIKPKELCQFAEGHRFTIPPNENSRSFISALLFTCSPSAVFWGIMAIVVDSLNGHIWARLGSHIQNEIMEIGPAFAYPDSPAAIIFIMLTIPILAAVFHLAPGFIFGTWAAMLGMAVRQPWRIGPYAVCSFATTTLRVTGLQESGFHNKIISADAMAVPCCRPTGFCSVETLYRKATEGFSNQVMLFWSNVRHSLIISKLSFSINLNDAFYVEQFGGFGCL